eukprot:GHVS01061376.1.p1 GENE.GHVS01061376.1~~GHVS01061376.1.p1  ORF type:complete len:936 (+),score=79.57 GHVS01061376.1:330-2810(+)
MDLTSRNGSDEFMNNNSFTDDCELLDWLRTKSLRMDVTKEIWLKGNCDKKFLEDLLRGLHGRSVRVVKEDAIGKAISRLVDEPSATFYKEVIPYSKVRGEIPRPIEVAKMDDKQPQKAGFLVPVIVFVRNASRDEDVMFDVERPVKLNEEKTDWGSYKLGGLLAKGFSVTASSVKLGSKSSDVVHCDEYWFTVDRSLESTKEWTAEFDKALETLVELIEERANGSKILFVNEDSHSQVEACAFALHLAGLIRKGKAVITENTLRVVHNAQNKDICHALDKVIRKFGISTDLLYRREITIESLDDEHMAISAANPPMRRRGTGVIFSTRPGSGCPILELSFGGGVKPKTCTVTIALLKEIDWDLCLVDGKVIPGPMRTFEIYSGHGVYPVTDLEVQDGSKCAKAEGGWFRCVPTSNLKDAIKLRQGEHDVTVHSDVEERNLTQDCRLYLDGDKLYTSPNFSKFLGLGALYFEKRYNFENIEAAVLTLFKSTSDLPNFREYSLKHEQNRIYHLDATNTNFLKWGKIGSILVMLGDDKFQAVVRDELSPQARKHLQKTAIYKEIWLKGNCDKKFLEDLLRGLHGRSVRVVEEDAIGKAISRLVDEPSATFYKEVIPYEVQVEPYTPVEVVKELPSANQYAVKNNIALTVIVRNARGNGEELSEFVSSLGFTYFSNKVKKSKTNLGQAYNGIFLNEDMFVLKPIVSDGGRCSQLTVFRSLKFETMKGVEFRKAVKSLVSLISKLTDDGKILFVNEDSHSQVEACAFALHLAGLIRKGKAVITENTLRVLHNAQPKPMSPALSTVILKYGRPENLLDMRTEIIAVSLRLGR